MHSYGFYNNEELNQKREEFFFKKHEDTSCVGVTVNKRTHCFCFGKKYEATTVR